MAQQISRQRQYQKRRREQGLCAVEGCPEHSGAKYYCPKHKKMHSLDARDLKREKRAARLAAAAATVPNAS